MANQIDGGTQTQGAISGIDQELQTQQEKLDRKARSKGRDDTLDEDLERERLQPGLNAEGTGGVGADPSGSHDGGNSNT